MTIGRTGVSVPKEFARDYKKFQSGEYGNISKNQFAKLKGIPISTFYKYESNLKTISKQERKDLKILADDFRLLDRADVQEIIKNCKSYAEGQQRIMRVYTSVYMH